MPIPRTDVDGAPQAAARAALEGDDIFFGRRQEGDCQVRWRVANMGPELSPGNREDRAIAPTSVIFSRAAPGITWSLDSQIPHRAAKGPINLLAYCSDLA